MIALGLDIGGANLKGATSTGIAKSEPFEIWRAPGQLATRLRSLIAQLPPSDLLAVTMTAELADCFSSKAEGVAAIIAAVVEATGPTPIVIWETTGKFTSPENAVQRPLTVAASNWQALATWAGRLASKGKGLLLDIGSTTTDIIPLQNGIPVARGATDLGRLLNHELVYTGMRRTPLCAVASSVVVRGQPCPIAAELFATTLDVSLFLGLIPEDARDCNTADGQPATIQCAHSRIARMVCCDRDEIDLPEARSIAGRFFEAQNRQISTAIDAVVARDTGRLETVIISGSGASLARTILAENRTTLGARQVSLADTLSPDLAEAACAYAIAVLAMEAR
jgi:probable H4MPT-linked C1 transfer pathway protein